jgi:aquaporin Z
MAIFADTDPNALGQVWVFVLVPLLASFAGLLVWVAISEVTMDDTMLDETFVDTGGVTRKSPGRSPGSC